MSHHVLIVDDDREIRASIVDLLEDEGYRVTVAENGEGALAALRETEKLPNLVLLDLMMPRVDGFLFRAEQLKDRRLSAIPIVLMSSAHDLAATAKVLNAQGYLQKPFADLEAIVAMVAQFC
jgi:two-component system response regulator MprA